MNRRQFLRASLAAPAVILTPSLLMPVKGIVMADEYKEYTEWIPLNVTSFGYAEYGTGTLPMDYYP